MSPLLLLLLLLLFGCLFVCLLACLLACFVVVVVLRSEPFPCRDMGLCFYVLNPFHVMVLDCFSVSTRSHVMVPDYVVMCLTFFRVMIQDSVFTCLV